MFFRGGGRLARVRPLLEDPPQTMCALLSLPLVALDSGWAPWFALLLTSCCCCCVFYLAGALLAVEGALHVDVLGRVWLRLPLHALAVWCGCPFLGLLAGSCRSASRFLGDRAVVPVLSCRVVPKVESCVAFVQCVFAWCVCGVVWCVCLRCLCRLPLPPL